VLQAGAVFENQLSALLVSPNQDDLRSQRSEGAVGPFRGHLGHPASTAALRVGCRASPTAADGECDGLERVRRDTIWTRATVLARLAFSMRRGLAFLDASYDSGRSRRSAPGLFCGLTNQVDVGFCCFLTIRPGQTTALSFGRHFRTLVAQDGKLAGFASKNNTLLQLQDTGLEFLPAQRAIDSGVFAPTPHHGGVLVDRRSHHRSDSRRLPDLEKLPAGTNFTMPCWLQLQDDQCQVARNISDPRFVLRERPLSA